MRERGTELLYVAGFLWVRQHKRAKGRRVSVGCLREDEQSWWGRRRNTRPRARSDGEGLLLPNHDWS